MSFDITKQHTNQNHFWL